MSEEAEGQPTNEQQARRKQIRRWYDEATAMGISEEDFIREMTPVLGLEEIERALDDDDEPRPQPLHWYRP